MKKIVYVLMAAWCMLAACLPFTVMALPQDWPKWLLCIVAFIGTAMFFPGIIVPLCYLEDHENPFKKRSND